MILYSPFRLHFQFGKINVKYTLWEIFYRRLLDHIHIAECAHSNAGRRFVFRIMPFIRFTIGSLQVITFV